MLIWLLLRLYILLVFLRLHMCFLISTIMISLYSLFILVTLGKVCNSDDWKLASCRPILLTSCLSEMCQSYNLLVNSKFSTDHPFQPKQTGFQCVQVTAGHDGDSSTSMHRQVKRRCLATSLHSTW